MNQFIGVASVVMTIGILIFFVNMIWSWKSGPVAPWNPWRGRTMEWLVSSPPSLFNFEATPQVVGGPYQYGVPGARHAVVFAPEEIGGELTETEKRTILVIADETVAANALVAEIRDRAKSGLWRFTIAVPNEGGDARAADRRLQATLSVLAEAGIDASGTVVEGDPFAATALVTSEEDVHEIMLATYPTGQSAWMRADMVDRLRKASGLGITRVVVSREEARQPLTQPGVSQVAVLADEALGAEGLVEALRQRSDERPIGVVLLYPMALDVAGWTDEAEELRNVGLRARPRHDRRAPARGPAGARRGARRRRRHRRPPRGCRPRGRRGAGRGDARRPPRLGGHPREGQGGRRRPAGRADRRRCGGAGLPVRELAPWPPSIPT